MKKVLILLIAAINFGCSLNNSSGRVSFGRLVCEYEESPLLVEEQAPRFGWQLHSTENGFGQTAYELEILDIKGNTVWLSGKIQSDESQHIPYTGKDQLGAGEQYQWRVRIWDNNDKSTSWSEKSFF